MDEVERGLRIAELNEELSEAKRLTPISLAARIEELGFSCLRCGECCRGEDNSVLVFPREVRRICAAAGLAWLEVAGPPEDGEWGRDGSFHTLEWRLKKDGESCRFYQEGRCSIYMDRPLLCRTYPFYLDRGELMHSECRGLGRRIDPGEAEKIAKVLISRQITEIEEAISLMEIYQDFDRGDPEERRGKGGITVHDSEGEHRIVGGELRISE
ncbi:MAG: YkgJ family cysteine cluster protein [Methanothrix sp.]|nr:YkgJ family cysteine cluster protein [Methanothrix sp.]